MPTDVKACLPASLTLEPESLMADVTSDPASLDAWLTRSRTPLAGRAAGFEDRLGRDVRPRVLGGELERVALPRLLAELPLALRDPFWAFARVPDAFAPPFALFALPREPLDLGFARVALPLEALPPFRVFEAPEDAREDRACEDFC